MRTLFLPISMCLIAGTLALAPVETAHACSPVPCAPSTFLPASGDVPSNAIEFLWRLPWTSSSTGASYAVHLYKLEGGQRSEIESEVLPGADGFKRVRPLAPVAEGSVLVLESAEPACTAGSATPAMVTVRASVPKPTRLGALSISETHGATTMNIPTARGSCTADFAVANARLKLTLDPGAQPFADSLRHALLVDGQKRAQHSEPAPIVNRYPLGGALEDVLYTLCKGESDSWTADLEAGTHRVQWISTLPDGSELKSDEITVDLQCSSGVKPVTDAGARPPRTGQDAQSDAPSATTTADATATTSTEDDVESESSADESSAAERRHVESCALRAPTRALHWPARLVALGLALLWLRRRA
jgi:hypothetical protein